MKKILSVLLISAFILSGCGTQQPLSRDVGISYMFNDVQKESEDEISANEAIFLISANLSPEAKFDLTKEKVVFSASGREEVEGTMCYTILFGVGQEDDFETIDTYAVDVHGGSIFEKSGPGEWKSVYSK